MRLLLLFIVLPLLLASPAAIVVAFSSADTRLTEEKIELSDFLDSKEVLTRSYWDSNSWEPDSADTFWHSKIDNPISSHPPQPAQSTAPPTIPGMNTKQTETAQK